MFYKILVIYSDYIASKTDDRNIIKIFIIKDLEKGLRFNFLYVLLSWKLKPMTTFYKIYIKLIKIQIYNSN